MHVLVYEQTVYGKGTKTVKILLDDEEYYGLTEDTSQLSQRREIKKNVFPVQRTKTKEIKMDPVIVMRCPMYTPTQSFNFNLFSLILEFGLS